MPNETTHTGAHVRGADDLKRTMNMVIVSMIPCLIWGMFNAGYQVDIAINGKPEFVSFFDHLQYFSTIDNLLVGATNILPILIVSYLVGLAIEFVFAVIKGHEVEEGYLVCLLYTSPSPRDA